jgi:hypothetical protein
VELGSFLGSPPLPETCFGAGLPDLLDDGMPPDRMSLDDSGLELERELELELEDFDAALARAFARSLAAS